MPQPFEADPSEVQRDPDKYVDTVIGNLQSQDLMLPNSDNMADFEQFESAMETLAEHTDDLANITFGNLVGAVEENSVVFILIRSILGISPPEWGDFAGDEAGIEIGPTYTRKIDNEAIGNPDNFISASDVREERVLAMLRYAADILNNGIGDFPNEVRHRLNKVDTGPNSSSLSELHEEGITYERLLHERYFGRPFASYRDSVSEGVGDRMEDAIEEELQNAGVPYYRTEGTDDIPGINPAPDFLIPSTDNPKVVIEAKIVGDGGTNRDKVGRFRVLSEQSRKYGNTDESSFQVIACIDGRGFKARRERIERLLEVTGGKVFTTQTLDQLVENTRISEFKSDRCDEA